MRVYYNSYDMTSGEEFELELREVQSERKRHRAVVGRSAMDYYQIAKSAKVSAHIHCPFCTNMFTKRKMNQVFCKPECGSSFNRQYAGSNYFKSSLKRGVCAGKLLGKTREELLQHLNAIKELPLHSIFYCAYCGTMRVKKREDQCFCANKDKCRNRFRLLIRDRRTTAETTIPTECHAQEN